MFGNGVTGDYVTNVIVSDPNGVIPLGEQALFPNYPIVGTRMDTALPSGNQGLNLIPGVAQQLVEQPVPIASGLVLSADFYNASARSDTLALNIYWDDLT